MSESQKNDFWKMTLFSMCVFVLSICNPENLIADVGDSAAAPDYTFTGDTDTGMYRRAANKLSFATAGTLALSIDASQNIEFKGTQWFQNPPSGVHAEHTLRAGSGANALIIMEADNSEDNVDTWKLQVADGGTFSLQGTGGGSWANALYFAPTSHNATFAGNVTLTGAGEQFLYLTATGGAGSHIFLDGNEAGANAVSGRVGARWDGNDIADIRFETGADTTNKDDGTIVVIEDHSINKQEIKEILEEKLSEVFDEKFEKWLDKNLPNYLEKHFLKKNN